MVIFMANVRARIGAILTFKDGSTATVNEGDCVTGLRYTYNKKEYTLDGCVRVVCARTAAYTGTPTTCPPEPYVHNYVTPTQLIIDSSTEHHAVMTRVNIADILSIEDVSTGHGEENISVGVGPQYRPLSEVLAAAEPGSVIELKGDTFEDDIVIKNGVMLSCDDKTVLAGAVKFEGSGFIMGGMITGPITMNTVPAEGDTESAPVNVVLSNVELTEKGTIEVYAIDRLTVENCYFHDHVFEASKGYMIRMRTEANMVIDIRDNTFGPEPAACYNYIECLAKLGDGSRVVKNMCLDKCCSHNVVNFYNAQDGATIVVSDNEHATADFMRIGFKGNVQDVTVRLENNVFGPCVRIDPAYNGYLCVQPYGTATTSFKGVTIELNNNECDVVQEMHLLTTSTTLAWTKETMPTVIIDGAVQHMPTPKAAVSTY
ncbi:MAG: hypothetical protein NC114_06770 [Ruminococcus flavefaciens]|nr:hypothetical protein [Ruminococcus flavefaciens]